MIPLLIEWSLSRQPEKMLIQPRTSNKLRIVFSTVVSLFNSASLIIAQFSISFSMVLLRSSVHKSNILQLILVYSKFQADKFATSCINTAYDKITMSLISVEYYLGKSVYKINRRNSQDQVTTIFWREVQRCTANFGYSSFIGRLICWDNQSVGPIYFNIRL